MKIFSERGITSGGKVLTYDEFYERIGWQNLEITPDKAEAIIERAEGYLEEEIPMLTLSGCSMTSLCPAADSPSYQSI